MVSGLCLYFYSETFFLVRNMLMVSHPLPPGPGCPTSDSPPSWAASPGWAAGLALPQINAPPRSPPAQTLSISTFLGKPGPHRGCVPLSRRGAVPCSTLSPSLCLTFSSPCWFPLPACPLEMPPSFSRLMVTTVVNLAVLWGMCPLFPSLCAGTGRDQRVARSLVCLWQE